MKINELFEGDWYSANNRIYMVDDGLLNVMTGKVFVRSLISYNDVVNMVFERVQLLLYDEIRGAGYLQDTEGRYYYRGDDGTLFRYVGGIGTGLEADLIYNDVIKLKFRRSR